MTTGIGATNSGGIDEQQYRRSYWCRRTTVEDVAMRRIPLSEFAKEHGHTKAAQILGCTQGGLSKAIRVGRDVYVTVDEDGTVTAQEQRPFPSQKSAA
ncbi:Cro/CI family transcriptional regulator [Pseudomonas shirazensis]